MAKKLKTGDVKRVPKVDVWNLNVGMSWLTLGTLGQTVSWGCYSREHARSLKGTGERIARILSIGPKYVTVRISK